jgi:hypothetical protein
VSARAACISQLLRINILPLIDVVTLRADRDREDAPYYIEPRCAGADALDALLVCADVVPPE